MRSILLAGISALGLSGAAFAQPAAQSVGSNQTATPDTQTSTAPAAAPQADTDTTSQIIVTAQRRSENLLQTAVGATVVSGADLTRKGVITVDSLQFAMPSVVVNNFGQGLEFNIRGIGKGEHNTQTTTGVITYRDGVPSFPGYFQEEPYFDIASLEVLRGPQGTIVGQNSTGGAVFVNTNDPVIGGGIHGYINASYGNYTDAGVQGAINIPLTDNLSIRAAFFGDHRNSFYHIKEADGSPYTGDPGNVREEAGRFSVLWKPTSNLSILSKTDIDYLKLGAYPADPYTDRFKIIPGTNTVNPNYTDLFDITANGPQSARDKFVRSILRVDYRFDSGIKFRSTTGFSSGTTAYGSDLDGTATGDSIAVPPTGANETFYDTVRERQISQEFTLISPDHQRFTWLIGAFGLWDRYTFPGPFSNFDIDVNSAQPGVAANNYELQGVNPESSLAGFGQVGFAITDSLKLDLGGRYTISHTTNHVQVLQYGALIGDDQASESRNFSYKATLGWKVDGNNYLYGFIASGFKPGGLNVPVGLGQPAPFGPEKVTSVEAGYKANFAGNHGHFTIDGFYNSYQDFQVIIGYPTIPTFGFEVNVPNATKIYGFEAEGDYRFGNLTVDAGINILKSKLGQFYASDSRIASLTPCDPFVGPGGGSCINLKGVQQAYAPNSTFNASVKYDYKIGDGDMISPSVNFGHVGPQWATLFENAALGDRLAARNIVNGQIAVNHKTWTVTGYVSNLTNQHYVAALNSGLDFAGAPRQYGVKLLKSF